MGCPLLNPLAGKKFTPSPRLYITVVTTGLTNAFVELTINSMKQFALFVTTKQLACNFSGPPQEGPEIFFSLASLALTFL